MSSPSFVCCGRFGGGGGYTFGFGVAIYMCVLVDERVFSMAADNGGDGAGGSLYAERMTTTTTSKAAFAYGGDAEWYHDDCSYARGA